MELLEFGVGSVLVLGSVVALVARNMDEQRLWWDILNKLMSATQRSQSDWN